jgi:hypothetical protein
MTAIDTAEQKPETQIDQDAWEQAEEMARRIEKLDAARYASFTNVGGAAVKLTKPTVRGEFWENGVEPSWFRFTD